MGVDLQLFGRALPNFARNIRTRSTSQSNGAVQKHANPARSRIAIEPVRMACCNAPELDAKAPMRMPPNANEATKPRMISNGSTLLRPAVRANTMGNTGRMHGDAMVAAPATVARA